MEILLKALKKEVDRKLRLERAIVTILFVACMVTGLFLLLSAVDYYSPGKESAEPIVITVTLVDSGDMDEAQVLSEKHSELEKKTSFAAIHFAPES